MKINTTVQTEDGRVTFTGELAQVEADLIMEVGLNYLLKAGVLPMVLKSFQGVTEDLETPQAEASKEVH